MKSLKSILTSADTSPYWYIGTTIEYNIIEYIRNNLSRKVINIGRNHIYLMVYNDICPLKGAIMNLEEELLSSEYIKAKCKASENYSKDVYAAMCNTSWYKDGEEWDCTFRGAGGIVADLNEAGTYNTWYCSGNEGIVTDEVRADFLQLGWKTEL